MDGQASLQPNRPRSLHQSLRSLADKRLSDTWFVRLAALSVWLLALTILSGAAVRLTGSGLGCPDWPTCASGNFVAPWQYHAWVEFGNRLITGSVSVVIALAVLGSAVRTYRRWDLIALSLGLVGGLVAEIILGGLTVEHRLAPGWVMAHFLLAIVFLVDAVVLHHRSKVADVPTAERPGWARPSGPAARLVSKEHVVLGRLLLLATFIVVLLGTVVTSTGPNGGAPQAPRFSLSLHDIAQLHGASVEVYIAFTILTLWSLSRRGAPHAVIRNAEVLLVVLLAQGAIGYTQYLLGVPAGLVELHVAGAVAVVVAVLRFNLCLYARPSTASEEPAGPPHPVAEPARAG